MDLKPPKDISKIVSFNLEKNQKKQADLEKLEKKELEEVDQELFDDQHDEIVDKKTTIFTLKNCLLAVGGVLIVGGVAKIAKDNLNNA